MCWQLYYLKIIKNEKRLEFERQFEDGELDLIHECNQILGNFNSFSDYYSMLKSSLQELKEYILRVEDFKFRFVSPIANKNVIVEINRKFINFASMFKTYLDYYEVQVKQIYGVESKELKEFKKKVNNEVFEISALTGEGIDKVLVKIAEELDNIKDEPLYENEQFEKYVLYKFKEEKPYRIYKDNDVYVVSGEEIEKLLRMTKFTDEGARRFAKKLRKMGVDEDLQKMGIQEGDTVRILDFEYEYKE